MTNFTFNSHAFMIIMVKKNVICTKYKKDFGKDLLLIKIYFINNFFKKLKRNSFGNYKNPSYIQVLIK